MPITPTHYMLLSAALFIIGVVGVMVRRNIIIIFMSIELILNAVNINLVAFSAELHNVIGQVFAVFVIAVAAIAAPATAAIPVSGNTEQVGWLLYTSYLIPFEIASMLLLVAMIGAIVLAKREL